MSLNQTKHLIVCKQMSSDLFKMLSTKYSFTIIVLIYV